MFELVQLQDTLLQREEELARLQDENNKLREFLNSSFVRNLEQKAKVCSPVRPVTNYLKTSNRSNKYWSRQSRFFRRFMNYSAFTFHRCMYEP